MHTKKVKIQTVHLLRGKRAALKKQSRLIASYHWRAPCCPGSYTDRRRLSLQRRSCYQLQWIDPPCWLPCDQHLQLSFPSLFPVRNQIWELIHGVNKAGLDDDVLSGQFQKDPKCRDVQMSAAEGSLAIHKAGIVDCAC